jgi:peptidyl-tRNA hydrolase
VNYVLGKWSEEEKSQLPKIIKECVDAILTFSFRGIQQSMNQFNK